MKKEIGIPWNLDTNLPIYVEDLIAIFDVSIEIKNPASTPKPVEVVKEKKTTDDVMDVSVDNSIRVFVKNINDTLKSEDFISWRLEVERILGCEALSYIGQTILLRWYEDCVGLKDWPYYNIPHDQETMRKIILAKYCEIPKYPALPKLNVGPRTEERTRLSFED